MNNQRNHWAGTLTLIRLILRRDRIVLPLWIISGALLAPATASSFAALYPDEAARALFVKAFAENPTITAMLGKVDSLTLGGLVVWRWSVAGIFIIGLANVLTVIRHSRNEEETGRAELIGSAVIGRFAQLSAVLIVLCCANILFAILVAFGMLRFEASTAGSLTLGFAVGAAGFFFAGIAALADRTASSARGARAIAGTSIGIFFIVSIIGNSTAGNNHLWWSPFGWVRLTHPYFGNDSSIIALIVAVSLPFVVVAYFLTLQRDINSGIFRLAHSGAETSPYLSSHLALAWRLHRTMFFWWFAGYAIIGAVFGVIAETASEQLMTSPLMAQIFSRPGVSVQPGDSLFTMSFSLLGDVLCLYVISATLQLHEEETSGRAEMLLSTSVERVQWALSHIFCVVVGSTLIFVGFGAASGLSLGMNTGNSWHETIRLSSASLAYLPALWIFVGVTVALFGFAPRMTVGGSWGALALCTFLDMAGEFKQISSAILGISPFSHVPKILLGEDYLVPIASLTATAALLILAGLAGLRRRDIIA